MPVYTGKTMPTEYKIGADPELFVKNSSGAFISGHDLIPGTKEQPFDVDRGAVQVDGVALEFNIWPADNDKEFQTNIKSVLEAMNYMVRVKNPDLRMVVSPTATFEKKYFRKIPAIARLLGCQPDFNAYSGKQNPPPGTKEPFRTGAGHIHVGWGEHMDINDQHHLYDCQKAVKQLDQVLYLSSLLWDDDEKRRTLYGKLGSFRPKHYGVEYRPLSNAWVADPDLHKWVFNATKRAMILLDEDKDLTDGAMAKRLISMVQKGEVITRHELVGYHRYLVYNYGIPKLPEAYLTTKVN